ncbi:MAG: hypothetical protein ACYC69_17475 [Thermodesulfovibrionales bacterium]
MIDSEVDRLAEDVMNAYVEFESSFHGKGRFPNEHFKAFFDAVVRYVAATQDAKMIHRNVASIVSGLSAILPLRTSWVPGSAIADADRMECMLFNGYDPHFEGDEPPGL